MPINLDDMVQLMSDVDQNMQKLEMRIEAELPRAVAQSRAAAAEATQAAAECREIFDTYLLDRQESAKMRESVWNSINGLDAKVTGMGETLEKSIARLSCAIEPLSPMIDVAKEKQRHRDAWAVILSPWIPEKKTAAVIGTIASAAAGVVAFWDQIRAMMEGSP